MGTPLTLEDMLNPIEEKEIGESSYRFKGGDDEIVDRVNYEIAVKHGEIVEIEDDEDDGDDAPDFTITEVICLCETMERLTLIHGDPESSLRLTEGLRKFRIHLRKAQNENATQTTLDMWCE
jgi:hypothetical protein